jgi:hypothetical protein
VRNRLVPLALLVLLLRPTPGRAQDPAAVADSLIRQRLGTARAPFVTMQDPAQPFGEGRFFNLAVRSGGPDARGARLFACVVRLQPRASGPACIPVPTPGIDPEVTADALSGSRLGIADFDDDDEPEVRFEVEYEGPFPRGFSGGETDEYRRFYVFDATPAPRFALNLLVRFFSYRSRMRNVEGAVEMGDLNGDGHGDFALVGESCAASAPREDCRPLRREFVWDRRSDGWREARTARR